MLKPVKILTKLFDTAQSWTLPVYEQAGGYGAARAALARPQSDLVAEVKKANIRGRGGAGFPTGVKWGFMRPDPARPAYLVVNADEGEPGTFKDRQLMEKDPHRCIEGCIISAYAIGAHVCYVYVRDELHLAKERLWGAIREAKERGHLGPRPFDRDYPIDVRVHSGAGAYICGEETALLESIEGKRGEPRIKPPFPAEAGLFGCPTTVNNLETIAAIPTVVEMGGDEFSRLSALHHVSDGGCRLFGVSGHVSKPGIYEACIGLTLRELIYDLGGGPSTGELLGVIPGGSSCPVLLASETVDAPDEKSVLHPWHGQSVLDVPIGVDTFKQLGTMVGTCCAIVLSDRVCPVAVMQNIMSFYRHESCGQCTPCREGTGWLDRIATKILRGQATIDDLDMVSEIASGIMGNTICAFGDGAAMPALALVRKFRRHFEDHVAKRPCSAGGSLAS
jgi:NADH-quinone oxidoreductase subunit F